MKPRLRAAGARFQGILSKHARTVMELRHLRYFVGVVDAGSLTEAAAEKLHTSQPSLSRQIRDLEYEVGVPLLTRSVSGVVPTAPGRAFLDHARLTLAQARVLARPSPKRVNGVSVVNW
jgi:DNA-binding transcriptional LysR family regulator